MRRIVLAALLLLGQTAFICASEGALRGKFAVSETDTVAFSRGNLQYQPSTNAWRFAVNQWNFVGTANGRIRSYQYSADGWVWTYDGWLDLFGWGTGNNPTASSTTNSSYGSFTDWGRNAVSNGGNQTNLWRTMTKDEWDYLYHGRENAASLYANGTVDGVNGSILLPDNWVIPAGLSFKASNNTDSMAPANNYTADEWILMEMAGAVFLPVTYERTKDWQHQEYCTAVYQQNTARYWTSTPNGTNGAYYYIPMGTPGVNQDNRYVGKAVRLVQNHDGSDLFPVMADANNALFSWTSVPNAGSYVLHVYEDSAHTEEAFYISFDRDGVVTGLHFVPHAPSRARAEEEDSYTERRFFYTLHGLQANTKYWFALSGEDSEGATISTVSGSFQTKAVEPAPDKVTVDPAQTTAVMTWPTDAAAGSYRIDIYKAGAVFCHLTLSPTGQLLGITFNTPGRRNEQMADGQTANPSTLSFQITGLEAATRYNYVLSALDESGSPLRVYTGAFATLGYPGELTEGGDEVIPTPPVIPANPEAQTPTGMEQEETEESAPDGKMLLNGGIVIRHNGRIFTLTGLEIQ